MKEWKINNKLQSDGRVLATWDSDFNSKTADIEIGEVAKGIIVEQLKQLESQKRLRLEMLDLYEKFVDGKTN